MAALELFKVLAKIFFNMGKINVLASTNVLAEIFQKKLTLS